MALPHARMRWPRAVIAAGCICLAVGGLSPSAIAQVPANLPESTALAPTEVNRANQAELEMVTGIGPDLSGRILAERAKAPFADWADFTKRLRGIGPVRAAQLSAQGLTVQGQAFVAPAKGR